MHMHVTTGDGMCQNVLIRKLNFVAQCRREAGLIDHLA
jgi:hypothetical protein